MCRFNLILFHDELGEKLLKSEGYNVFYENLSGLKAYRAGYCNCSSFVGSMIEKRGMSYESARSALKKERLEQLYRIRELLHQPDYQERKERFEQQRDLLLKELQPYQDQMFDYEMKQMEELEANYEGDELQKKREELYTNLGNMIKGIGVQADYELHQKAYHSFLQENNIMNEATTYYLTKEEEEKARDIGLPLPELLGLEREEELENQEEIYSFPFAELEMQSRVIDEVILKEEEDTCQNHREEYEEYIQLFKLLLEYIPSFKFATIWSDTKKLKNVKTVEIGSVQIDDLAFLDFDEMVTISR